ncbi:hypothetical protein [Coraliomargarita parva]|uniref:hypothetical protein n=1 Tax=Coraliomargarita parva TaxID=3014050 RepID=UPI0022B58FA9|nr:hypothetical protein [Coraliomargarita parva]
MIRKAGLLLILSVLGRMLSAEDLPPELVKQYEGRWVGEFTVYSSASDYSETFIVEQQYWYKDGILRGVSVSQRESGISSSRSETKIVEGKLISEVSHSDGQTEQFIGTRHEGGIVWIPADMQRATDYQIKETFKEEAGDTVMQTEGFDSYVYADGLAQLVYKGHLVKSGTEAD